MRFSYWTIRAVPQPMGITTLGVGVIVLDPESGEVCSQFRRDRSLFSATEFDSAIITSINLLERELEEFRSPQTHIALDSNSTLAGMLSLRQNHWNNLLRIDPVRQMDAADLSSALDLLFETYIGHPPTRQLHLTIPTIQRNIRKVYEEFPNLRKATIMEPQARVSSHEINLNLAVVEHERVFELNSAFNFSLQDVRTLHEKTELWSLKIDKLRQLGGELQLKDTVSELAPTVRVVAMYEPPRTDLQLEVFTSISSFWKELSIEAIPVTDAKSHANTLESLLLAS